MEHIAFQETDFPNMYYANENRLGNESPHDNKYPFDLENKSPGTEIWGTKVCEIENLILNRLYFSAKGTKTGKLCVKATWEVINPIKCYEHEHPSPSTIWLRH